MSSPGATCGPSLPAKQQHTADNNWITAVHLTKRPRIKSKRARFSPPIYNVAMRRKSSINREKRLNLAERARRQTPEQRLETAANLSQAVKQIEREGKRHRERDARRDRP